MKIQSYVLGLMFSCDFSQVILIRKARPEWQSGKLNGIGGKVEECENIQTAMTREFHEETGIETSIEDWGHFASMSGPDFKVDCFVGVCGDLGLAKSVEAEPVEIINVEDIHWFRKSTTNGLQWLIPLGLDFMKDGEPFFVTANYGEWPKKAAKAGELAPQKQPQNTLRI